MINVENNKSSLYKQSIFELLSQSTIHGIPKAVSSKRTFFRFMWIFLLALFSVACFYYATKSITEFFNYDTVTTFKNIYEERSQFPAISICNINNRNFTISFLSIHFDYRKLAMNKYFEVYDDPAFGKCYRFNTGKNLTGHSTDVLSITNPGIFYAFRLNIYSKPLYDFDQLVIYIHNQTLKPLTVFNKGHSISPGTNNYFVIERIFEKRLPLPYNDCYEDFSLFPLNKTLIEFILNKGISYTKSECVRLCQNLYYIRDYMANCGCFLNSLDESLFLKCKLNTNNNQSADCVTNLLLEFAGKTEEKCREYCPFECRTYSIDIKQYSETLISKGNITNRIQFKFPEFNTYENVSRSFFSISVYYDELKYTLISQRPQTETFDLISNIGGIVGLFLGMGLMSFMELFEIIFEGLFIKFNQ